MGVKLNPPTPVTVAEQGVWADPVYVYGPAGQLTVVVDVAWVSVMVLLSELPV